MVTRFLFVFMVLLPALLAGQPLTIARIGNSDSLKSLLTLSTGRDRVDLLNKIAHSVHSDNPEDAYRYAQDALELSDRIGYTDGKAGALWLLSYQKPGSDQLQELYRAKEYINDSTYWVIKYKILNRIRELYFEAGEEDSSFLYFRKVLTEIQLPEGFMVFYNSCVRTLNYYYKQDDWTSELEVLKRLYNLFLRYGCPVPKKHLFTYAGQLGRFYTRHGYYELSVNANKRILDSIDKYGFNDYVNTFLKAKFLGDIGRAYNHWGKYDSALIFHNSSIEKFESLKKYTKVLLKYKLDWKINLANQIEGKAIVLMHLGFYDSSRVGFNNSLEIRKKIKDDLGVAMCLDGLGELFQVQGNYPKALEKLDKALDMKKNYKATYIEKFDQYHFQIQMIDESISVSYLYKGKLFYDWGKYDLALEQFNKSLELCEQIKYSLGKAKALLKLGDVYLEKDSVEIAKINFHKAYDLNVATGNLPGKAESLSRLGDLFMQIGDTEKAMNYYNRSLSIFEKTGLQKGIAETCLKIGGIYASEEKYGKAISKFEKSVNIAEPIKLTKCLMNANKGLSDIYSAIGLTNKAFDYYKKYIAARDTLFTLESNRQIANLEAINRAEKKESEVKVLLSENRLKEYKLNRSRYMLISVGGLTILLVILAVLYFRQEKLKLSQQNIMLEQQLLRTQMNPHFIFNALTNIQSFIYQKDSKTAASFLAVFAGLMRNILECSKENYIPLEKEITTITNYMKLQKLRLGKKLEYSIKIDDSINTDEYQIPPMLAQPFLENAIEHGIIHKEGTGCIDVNFSLSDNGYILFEITDDGVGRERSYEIEKNKDKVHVSMATAITRDRLLIINKKLKKKISLSIIDLKNENGQPTGTKVRFEIPKIYS